MIKIKIVMKPNFGLLFINLMLGVTNEVKEGHFWRKWGLLANVEQAENEVILVDGLHGSPQKHNQSIKL